MTVNVENLSAAAVVVGLIVAAVPTVIGWLFVRAVRGVDRNLDSVNRKLEQLVALDTGRQVDIADLRARVVHLEYVVLGNARGGGELPAVKS